MLFVAEYTFPWDALPTVAAKRLEWDVAQPEGFRFVGEWVWKDRDPAFRGIAVLEVDDVAALNAFALHYGATITLAFHAASDVMSAITQMGAAPKVRLVSRRPRAKRGA